MLCIRARHQSCRQPATMSPASAAGGMPVWSGHCCPPPLTLILLWLCSWVLSSRAKERDSSFESRSAVEGPRARSQLLRLKKSSHARQPGRTRLRSARELRPQPLSLVIPTRDAVRRNEEEPAFRPKSDPNSTACSIPKTPPSPSPPSPAPPTPSASASSSKSWTRPPPNEN